MPTTVIPYRRSDERYILDHDNGPVDVRLLWDAMFYLTYHLSGVLEEFEHQHNQSLYNRLRSLTELAKVVDCLDEASGRGKPESETERHQRVAKFIAERKARGESLLTVDIARALDVPVELVNRHVRAERAEQDAAERADQLIDLRFMTAVS